jgi:hypothetical protein
MGRIASESETISTGLGSASADLFCISCGYNQRGIAGGRCPECGEDYVKLPPSPTRLPWLHRRHLGVLRGYWRTAGMVIFRKQEFCEQIDTPVTLRDGRRFWVMAVLAAWAPLVAVVVALYLFPQSSGFLKELRAFLFQSMFLPIPLAVFILTGLFVLFAAATGMPSYFCHPRALPVERQNRAIALSYFAGAPIALMLLIALLAAGAELLTQFETISTALRFSAALVGIMTVGTWYVRTAGIVLTLSQRQRKTLTILILTCAWCALAVLCLVILPLAIWYAIVTTYSLF